MSLLKDVTKPPDYLKLAVYRCVGMAGDMLLVFYLFKVFVDVCFFVCGRGVILNA